MTIQRFKLPGAFSVLCAVSILSTLALPHAAFADEPAPGEDVLFTAVRIPDR